MRDDEADSYDDSVTEGCADDARPAKGGGYLVKRLRLGEGFKLGEVATIRVVKIERGRVHLGMKAPTLEINPLERVSIEPKEKK